MNIAETISVNPVSKTLGALNPEATINFIHTHQIETLSKRKASKSSRSALLFASSTPGSKDYGVAMLLLRLLFSALLIVSGSFIISGEISSPVNLINTQYFGLAEIIAGTMLALGLMSRIAMTASTIFFGYISYTAIMTGIFDMQALLCCLTSGVFMVLGAGKYSSDFLIRKAMILRRRRRQKQLCEERLSYRAFRLQNM